MPLDGSGVASKPSGTTAVSNTVIDSSKFNSVIDDIYAIFNVARPIAKGGTGETTAYAAGDALSVKGADVASAATTDLGAATGRFVHVTGTTTITAFGTADAGVQREVTFDGVLTLTHNATSLILPGGANITTAAGDTAILVSEGSGNWRCVSYQRAALAPSVASTAKFWADITVSGGTPTLASGFNVSSIVDTSVGQCTVMIGTDFATASWTCAASVQSPVGTTVFINFAGKAAGSVLLQAISLADALTDPASYNVVGFGAQ